MRKAFCPAHVTGFFAPVYGPAPGGAGSVGGGICLDAGVETRAEAGGRGLRLRFSGHAPGGAAVSEEVAAAYGRLAGRPVAAEIRHTLGVPAGYGLGCSAAAALSLSLALDAELGTGLGRAGAARVAHEAEVACGTGLGDVAAACAGGIEARAEAGRAERLAGSPRAVLACFAPVPTAGRLRAAEGLPGAEMARRLRASADPAAGLQEMSAEFARRAGMVTPRMERAAADLRRAGLGCGAAMIGETLFALCDRAGEERAAAALEGHPCLVIRAGTDREGARLL